MTIAAGTKLGPYEISAPLGAGGMGEVYRARDTRVGREVAVKILPRDFAADPQRRRRFEQEARLAASLNHPNIVGLFDVGIAHDPPYIVSELVPGVSLRAVMSRGAIPVRKVLDLGAQMAEGLAAAHTAGVVHRDIKPENVMVTPEGRVKILDFGLARVQEGRGVTLSGSQTVTVGSEAPHPTSPGMVVGTVAYMSPEQASGHTVDYRSDQFSLGLVLYEMLSRRRAFERASTAQTMAAIIEDEAPPLPATTPTQVRWVVGRCLAKDPPHRYASTLDLARELRHLGEHASELMTPSGESAVAKRRRGLREFRAVAVLAAAIAVVCLGVGRLSVDEPRADQGPYKLTPFAAQEVSPGGAVWSPDGKSIAFVAREGQIVVEGVDAPNAVQLTSTKGFRAGDLVWTRDSRGLYCRGGVDSVGGVFRVSVGGGDPVLVQRDAGIFTLSPDGKVLIMFCSDPEHGTRVWYASPPDAPRRLYEPVPFAIRGGLGYMGLAFAPNGTAVIATLTDEAGPASWSLPWPPGKARLASVELSGSAWMPDSRHVVRASGNRVLMIDTRTERSWPLFVSSTDVADLDVSPDGTRIAFESDLSHGDVIEMPTSEGPPRTILGSARSEWMPTLSADGKELVYVGDPRGTSEVWSRNMEDGSLRRLLGPADFPADSGYAVEYLGDPVLSPDRRRIAVVAVSGKGPVVYTAFTAGGAPVRGNDVNAVDFVGSWSPEGDRLAYVRVPFLGAAQLVVGRIGSAEPPITVADSVHEDALPEWSPTGEWIATGEGGGTYSSRRILLVSPDGRVKRKLSCHWGPLTWSRDGRTLFVMPWFYGARSLVAIDVRRGVERVLRFYPKGQGPASRFVPGWRLSITPDNKTLIYSVYRERRELWLLEGIRPPESWYTRLWPR